MKVWYKQLQTGVLKRHTKLQRSASSSSSSSPSDKEKITMKLVWSPETASNAYIDTVKCCKGFTDSGVAELLSSMAAGWNAKLIVETWSLGSSIATSIGLAVAATHTCARHVCIVPDERSKSEYLTATRGVWTDAMEVVVGEQPDEVVEGLTGVEFMVVDSKRRDFDRLLRVAKLGQKGAVLALKNATQCVLSGFRWQGVIGRETRVVRSVFLPVGSGLEIAHVGRSSGSGVCSRMRASRWIKHIDQRSGEEHVIRGV